MKPLPWISLWIFLAMVIVSANAQTYSLVKSFKQPDSHAAQPTGRLVQGPDGALYGAMNDPDFSSTNEAVFKINTDGSGFTILKYFTNAADGVHPQGGLVISGNTLYGTAISGGTKGYGTLFEMGLDGSAFQVLENFDYSTNGYAPNGDLLLDGNMIYGTTTIGGPGGPGDPERILGAGGTVFRIKTDGTGFATLGGFDSTEQYGVPNGGMIIVGNTLYGTMQGQAEGTIITGDVTVNGGLFRVNTDGSEFVEYFPFDDNDAYVNACVPEGGVVSDGQLLYGTTYYGGDIRGSAGYGTVFAVALNGLYNPAFPQDGESDGYMDVLHIFNEPANGTDAEEYPATPMVLHGDTLYGTTQRTVFSASTTYTGALGSDSGYTVVKQFPPGLGLSTGGLLLISNTLYGVTGDSIYKVNIDGSGFAILKLFAAIGTDGGNPWSDLTPVGNSLYGTTQNGGLGLGTVFKVNPDGSGFQTIKSFGADDPNQPEGGLATDGVWLYGTATAGPDDNAGAVFKMSLDGSQTILLKTFTGDNGDTPTGDLALNGTTLYGTTEYGGTNGSGTIYQIDTSGNGFSILKSFPPAFLNASSGQYTNHDGLFPFTAGLVLNQGILYGTAIDGGGVGRVFCFDCEFARKQRRGLI